MIERPIFHQYTILEEVQRFIPASLSRSLIVVKEFLDNAADEAEKTDYKVSIELKNKIFKIKNKGVLTEKDIISITDFSKLVSTKHLKKCYQRGAIGHGLKIALMLSDIDNHPVTIISNKKQYKITLLDRKAKSPQKVVNVEVQDDNSLNEDETCFIIPLPEEDLKLKPYIEKFIIVNPHIEFTFNNHKYLRTYTKKPYICDINSYTDKELIEMIEEYISHNYSYHDICLLFGINRSLLKRVKIDKFSQDKFFQFLKNYAKPLKPFLLGKKAIQKRINFLKYKCLVNNKQSLEVIVTDNSVINEDVFVVNGSIVNSLYFTEVLSENITTTRNLEFFIENLKKKKTVNFIVWYYSPNISYRDPNKREILINFDVSDTLKKVFEKIPKSQLEEGNWLKIKNKCIEEAKEKKITSDYIKKQYGVSIQPWRYVFFTKCKEIIDSMIQKYGIITIRQLYYQLVSKGYITNSYLSYTNLDNSLTDAREIGIIDYFVFEDRSRYEIHPNVISINSDPVNYLKKSLLNSLKEPQIDKWEFQDYYLELWIEKDALVRLFTNIANKYQLLLFPSRGYTSVTKIHNAIERFKEKTQKGKKCIVLYFGDLDPSGWDIYRNIKEKLKNQAEVIRVMLNPNQKEIYENLVPMPLKPKDTRSSKFQKNHNLKHCYELDAVDPELILNYTEENVKKFFDPQKAPDTSQWYELFEKTKKSIENYIYNIEKLDN